MSAKDQIIENPVIGDKVTFVQTGDETEGEFLLLRFELAPGGGNPLHFHYTFTEQFECVEGQLDVMLNREHKKLDPGQSAFIPLKAKHRFFNTSEAPVTFTVEIRPVEVGGDTLDNTVKALQGIYGLAKDGKTNAKSQPTNIWYAAILFDLAETYVAGVPVFIQRALLGSLAVIARRLGKHNELAKYW